ncbi:hypothetical protein TRFO_34123 [Tritrichomonas foetus]|uniref:Calponin-homology (CH) domain-containing protein n=1 Tax=Tritrichomonas foetus TaxID=1144522 RepID=A0A1J4JQ93_9EUKA|nr:hypothetical protein TRFO_34123 [Tritrichomonas foetus]|eukprot:OHS99404.1 hypothetical protein TRFO_34123 [Tritrichomonas foetus]
MSRFSDKMEKKNSLLSKKSDIEFTMTTPQLPHPNENIPTLQTKVFSRWASMMLRKRGIIVRDITTQLTSGVNLVNLAEVLTGEIKHHMWSRNPTKPFQKVENCEFALNLFKEKGVKIINVTAKDITDGNVKLTLNLIWTLILKYTVEPVTGVMNAQNPKRAMYQVMIRWFLNQISEISEIINNSSNVTNNSNKSDSSDAKQMKPFYLSFAALLAKYRPDLIDYKKLLNEDKELISQQVVETLKKLEVPTLIDSEDLLGEIDEKSLITQLALIKKHLPQHEEEENQVSKELLEECESEEINEQNLDFVDIDDDSQLFQHVQEVFEEPQSNRPFMLLMTITEDNDSLHQNSTFNNNIKGDPQSDIKGDVKNRRRNEKTLAMTIIKEPSYLNPAGMKLDLDIPDPKNPAQLFTFGDGEWITVIDSVMQPGMVWDVADRDNLNPPEGTPFYMFMLHGRHNQRFTYKGGHIIAKQNGQVVTYVGGPQPMVMRRDNSSLYQTFRLKYV